MSPDLIPCCGHCDHMPPRDGHDDACRHGCNDPKPQAVLICSDERHAAEVNRLKRQIEVGDQLRATYIRERDASLAEVERLRAGEDHTPHDGRVWPTPGQFIHQWNSMTGDQRLETAARVIRDSEVAHEAFMCAWKERAKKAEAELLRLRLAQAQPASPAADGEHPHVCVTCAATWDGEKWVTA